MPVESELLHLRVPLCWAGDPALDGGSRAPHPPEVGPARFTSRNPAVSPSGDAKLKETGAPRGRPRGVRYLLKGAGQEQQSPGHTHWAPQETGPGSPLGPPALLSNSTGCLPAPQGRVAAGDLAKSAWVQRLCLCCWTSATGTARESFQEL